MRRTLAVFAAVVLGLLASAGQASASDPGSSAEQAAAQAAASGQAALALAGALQGNPSNDNIAVRVLSPGDAGSVSQSNTVIAGSVAANGNSTAQTANQTQSAPAQPGASGTQTAGQIAGNDQSAVSTADAQQTDASNENIDVRVLSPGDGGSVTQSNTVLAGSIAANGNETTQSANQSQAGGSGSGYSQTVGQAASNKQDADADATATQDGAKNKNIAVRVLSPGDDGSVAQSNTVAGIAAALNGNETNQTASQTQSGGPTGSGTQTATQGATSDQSATSAADAEQRGASNENIGVRVLSPGDGGSVSQSNTVVAGSLAANGNDATQTASQSQAGGNGTGQQVAGQVATNDQDAWADSNASQNGASNTNIPVRVLSEGDDGAVSQANTVKGIAAALNGNETTQSASQTQAGGGAPSPMASYLAAAPLPYPVKEGGPGVQVVGQLAQSTQDAGAVSNGSQEYASNVNAPVRIGSPGGGGSVDQSNTVLSAAISANGNETSQTSTQSQAGIGGTLVQAAGQAAVNKQDALACANALQQGVENTNTPVRLFSEGDDGAVSQSNTAAAVAKALNLNGASQSANQSQAGGGSSPLVQAVGQAAGNEQAAAGSGNADQRGTSNESKPIVLGDDLRKKCDGRKQSCEEKLPVEPKSCELRTPELERCEPCERLKQQPCSSRRSQQAM
jgi:hypothetical protein